MDEYTIEVIKQFKELRLQGFGSECAIEIIKAAELKQIKKQVSNITDDNGIVCISGDISTSSY